MGKRISQRGELCHEQALGATYIVPARCQAKLDIASFWRSWFSGWSVPNSQGAGERVRLVFVSGGEVLLHISTWSRDLRLHACADHSRRSCGVFCVLGIKSTRDDDSL